MSTAALRLHYRSLQHKVLSAKLLRMPSKTVYILAIVCSAVLLVFYIAQVNSLTKGAFLIKTYNKQVNTLMAENRQLQDTFAESGFLGQVSSHAKELGFQKTTRVTYIQMLQHSLAKASNASIR